MNKLPIADSSFEGTSCHSSACESKEVCANHFSSSLGSDFRYYQGRTPKLSLDSGKVLCSGDNLEGLSGFLDKVTESDWRIYQKKGEALDATSLISVVDKRLDDSSYCLARARKLRETAQSKLTELGPIKLRMDEVTKKSEETTKELNSLVDDVNARVAEVRALAERADSFSSRARKLLDSRE